MAAHAPESTESQGFVFDHPGITSILATIVLAVGFVYAVYAGGTSGDHKPGAHGVASGAHGVASGAPGASSGAHGVASGAPGAASGAPAASASAAAPAAH